MDPRLLAYTRGTRRFLFLTVLSGAATAGLVLAQAVGLLKAEWHARTGSSFEVVEPADESAGESSKPHPDAIVCAAALLGELVEADSIARGSHRHEPRCSFRLCFVRRSTRRICSSSSRPSHSPREARWNA